jgi:hypothetical protein
MAKRSEVMSRNRNPGSESRLETQKPPDFGRAAFI